MLVKKSISFILIIFTALTLFACAPGPHRSQGNWGHMMGYGHGGGFMGLLFLILVAVIIYFLFKSSPSQETHHFTTETPIEILKKRYANGEVNKEEFDRIKKDLEAS